MAAPPTGATAGKGSVRATARSGDATLAALAGQSRLPTAGDAPRAAAATPANEAGQGEDRLAGRNTSASASDAGSAAEGTRATAQPPGAKPRAATVRAAPPRAGFAQALAQSLAPPPAQGFAVAVAGVPAGATTAGKVSTDEPQAELGNAASEATARKDDTADAGLAGDAASATVAAVLQWLRPVAAAHPGDSQGDSPGGGQQRSDAGVGAIGPMDAATAGGEAAAETQLPLLPGLPVNAAAAAMAAATLAQAGSVATGAAGESKVAGPAAEAPAVAGERRAPGPAGTAPTSQVLDPIAQVLRDATMLADAGTGRGSSGRQGSGDPGQDPGAAASGSAAGAAAGSAAAMAGALRTAANAVVTERTVPVDVHDRHWPHAVAGQVLVLTDQRIDTATLRLSPEHLGPVEVHIDLQSQGVNVSFHADHADTRTALEQALPQLRAAFAGAGLTLGQATVQQQMRQGSQNAPATAQDPAAAADHREVTPAVIRAIGLVDEYA